jgi:hypothetical protein
MDIKMITVVCKQYYELYGKGWQERGCDMIFSEGEDEEGSTMASLVRHISYLLTQ